MNQGTWPGWIHDDGSGVIKKYCDQIGDRGLMGAVLLANSVVSPKGMIECNWDDPIPRDGVEPSYWKSTSQVIAHRIRTGSPVKYGQCWVVAECLSGVLRHLGYETRVIIGKGVIIDVGNNRGYDVFRAKKSGKKHIKFTDSDVAHYILSGCNDISCRVKGKAVASRRGVMIQDGDDPLVQDSIDVRDAVGDGDSAWNFHVWVEVLLDGKWCAIDATPCLADPHGKGYYGPVPVESIKSGICPEGIDRVHHSFLFSAFNGVPRYWRSFMYEGNEILFPYLVDFGAYRRSEVTMRDSKRNVTSSYRGSYTEALKAYYASHPILSTISGKKFSFICRRANLGDEYLVQIVWLDDSKNPLSCLRKVMRGHEVAEISLSFTSRKVSILIIDVKTRQVFIEVISKDVSG